MSEVRWGIMGTGAVAGLFAEALASVSGARLHAVASSTRERAKEFADWFGASCAYEGYERLVEDPAVDIVYVATANERHCNHCLQAIQAGKPVLCEKPFALNAAEARDVVEAARRRSVFCMEAMWMRFSPAMREALQTARRGGLGELRLLSAQLGFPYQLDPQNRVFTKPGGGALLDLGVYPLSLAQALFGHPVRIASSVEIGLSGVDEQFAAVLDYEGGRQAVIAASLRAQLANAATINGTKGVLEIVEPLYFPERYRLLQTSLHGPMPRGSRNVRSELRLHPWVRAIADLRARTRWRNIVRRPRRSGYSFEVEEAQRCLRLGLRESPEMPLDDTLAVLECVDTIRQHSLVNA
jgi:predicted dehydrogenase